MAKKSKKATKQPTYSSIKDTAIKQITKNYNTAVGNTQEKKPTVGVMFNTNTSNNYMRRMAEQTTSTASSLAKPSSTQAKRRPKNSTTRSARMMPSRMLLSPMKSATKAFFGSL